MKKNLFAFAVVLLTTLSGVTARAGNVFGEDNRVDVSYAQTPYKSIVYVGGCTGSLVWKNLVLTASHCIFDWVQKGSDGSYSMVGEHSIYAGFWKGTYQKAAQVQQIWWGELTDKPGPGDWAILRIDSNLGDSYGYFGAKGVSKGSDIFDPWNTGMTLAGFGGDLEGVLAAHAGCNFRDFTSSGLVLHDCDMVRGNSGGPIFKCDRNTCWIVAIVSGERRNGGEESLMLAQYDPSHANVAVNATNFVDKIVQLRKQYPNGAGSF